jgi:hypothetical protein
MNAPSRTKYLTYTPWPGELNNTRMSFETSLVLAYLSGRCLVMPREYRRRGEPETEAGKFRPLHPQECFELESLNRIVPVLSYEEYERSLAPGQRTERVDMILKPQTTVFCFPEIPPLGTPEAKRLRDFAVTRQQLMEITPEMKACRTLNIKEPLLEHFYSFFYFSQKRDEVKCKRLVREHVRFRAAVLRTADKIVASLGSYCALHVRRNDFLRQYPWQDISVERVLSNVRMRVPAGARLYIASDETDRNFFAALRNGYEVRFIEDFRSVIPEDSSEALIACVEQVVCAFAKLFIGTKLSTYSGYITRLRGYYGVPEKSIYFTDGSPGSEMDDRGSPPFSWRNWMQSGNPLWGREFKEAWEL